jgi:hypothetical protein
MRCEREIVGENFEKKKKVRNNKKKRGNKILGEIVGKKKTWKKI